MSSFNVGDPSRANDDWGVDNSTRRGSPTGGTPGIPDTESRTDEPPRVAGRVQRELEDTERSEEPLGPRHGPLLGVQALAATAGDEPLDAARGLDRTVRI